MKVKTLINRLKKLDPNLILVGCNEHYEFFEIADIELKEEQLFINPKRKVGCRWSPLLEGGDTDLDVEYEKFKKSVTIIID